MRLIGRFFLVVGMVFLGLDISDADEKGQVVLMQLGLRWYEIDPNSYLLVEPAISRHVSVDLWDYLVLPIMLTPAFLLFFGLWLFFSLISWLIGRVRARQEEW